MPERAYAVHPLIRCEPLPVDVVFHPSWWFRHAGITFDEDFFYHPLKRVEAEKKMEDVLYDRLGQYGLGSDHGRALPVIGAVHLAAGYIIQEMLGCKVEYREDAPPQVIPAGLDRLDVDPEAAFRSPAFDRLTRLIDALQLHYGYVTGDVNWAGILNVAMDLAGQQVLTGLLLDPAETVRQFHLIASVIDRFVSMMAKITGTTSVSVNRNVRHIEPPVFLHSECTHTMISVEQYEDFLLDFDLSWSRHYRPFGIHYCGKDPHRFAESFATIPNLDFLDVGWGGDIALLRHHLPTTFLNIRLDPVSLNDTADPVLEETILRLVSESGNPYLTGICCINMDDRTEDSKVDTIFRVVAGLRERVYTKLR
jgi:hypothetical protein